MPASGHALARDPRPPSSPGSPFGLPFTATAGSSRHIFSACRRRACCRCTSGLGWLSIPWLRWRVPTFTKKRKPHCIWVLQGIELATSLAVINCSQVVTLAGPARPRVGPEMRALGIIADGALLVASKRIERVGSRDEIERLITAECEVIDAGGRVVMPGFVDGHTHPRTEEHT